MQGEDFELTKTAHTLRDAMIALDSDLLMNGLG